MFSCVDKIDTKFSLNATVLSIEGIVSDQNVTQITINQSVSNDRSVLSYPMEKCKVDITVDNSEKIVLTETQPGVYAPPASFIGKIGKSYQLHFTTADGKTYESSVEKLLPSPPIKKIYQQFNANGQLSSDGKKVLYSTFDIFVDFDDDPAQKNYYLWDYYLYERLYICITCEKALLQGITCVPINSRNAPSYDYVCQGDCYDIFRNDKINVFSDEYANGKAIVGKSIAKIPYYNNETALLDVRQYSISKSAYEYYKLIIDQTQSSGTLTDTPPAAIVGNVKNVNDPTEKVVGIFSAVGTAQAKYVINRAGYNRLGTSTTVLGRQPILEPSAMLRPPLMPCIVSKTRVTSLPK